MVSLATASCVRDTGIDVRLGRVRGRRSARCRAANTSNSQYVRKHILDLAPYTPIVPFEVLSGKPPAVEHPKDHLVT